MISAQDNAKEKALFSSRYLQSFTPYLDIEKLEKKIPHYRYLNDELHKIETNSNESTIKHVMSKKVLLNSKNAKQLCRDGIPLRNMKTILLKMFNAVPAKDEFDNRRAEVLKGRQFSEVGGQVPTFCDKSLEETLPFHYLNEQGVQALKELLWVLNGVVPKMEYCPCLVSIASILLLFMSKEDAYALLRNIIESDLITGSLSNLRWHFRYSLDENIRLYLSIVNSIMENSKSTVINQFKLIENYGLPKVRLIQDMADKFFLDYVNFIGIIKFLPYFLYEGVSGIYRFAYGIIAICPFKLVKETKQEDRQNNFSMSLLEDQLTLTFDYDKRPEEEVFKLYKDVTNKLENWYFFLDSATEWDLTSRNNGFTSQKIPSEMKNLFPEVTKSKYVPALFPESKILTKDILPKLWAEIPPDVKYSDGQLLLDKASSPDGDLNALYNICEKMDDRAMILFVIKTKNGEIFGGIMDQGIKLYEDGRYRTPISAYLFSAEPKVQVWKPKDRMHSEMVCFEAGAFRFGNGEDGPAITLESDLKVGWTQRNNTVFGNNVDLLKDYANDGEFIIDNLEIYIMQ
jgi:hypothetical protein